MGFHIDFSDDVKQVAGALTVNPASVFSKPFAGYLLFLFQDVSPGDKRIHEWMRRRADMLDEATGEAVGFAIFTTGLSVDVRVGDGGSSMPWDGAKAPAVRAEFDPCEHQANCKGYDIRRLVSSGLFGTVTDEARIEAVNKAVIRLARELKVMDQLPCVVALDGFPHPGMSRKVFGLDKVDLAEFDSAIVKAVGRLECHPNYKTYRERIESLHRRKDELDAIDKETAASANRDDYGKRVFFKALRQGERDKLSGVISSVIDISHDDGTFWGEFFEECDRLSRLQKVFSTLGDWKTLRWPLDGEELRIIEGIIKSHWDLLSDVTGMGCFPDALKSEGIWKKWIEAFGSDWGQLAKLCFERLDAHVGKETMKSIYGQIRWEDLAEKRNALVARINLDIDALTQMEDRPSWMSILESAIEGKAESNTTQGPYHLSGWMLGEGMVEAFFKSYLNGSWNEVFERIVAKHGKDALTRKPNVFISYAREDEQKVIERETAIQIGVGHVFRDRRNLMSGDDWEKRLYEEIESRDIFYLCWSNNAVKAESFVRNEYLHALRHGKDIRPEVISRPCPEIPKELKRITFTGYV